MSEDAEQSIESGIRGGALGPVGLVAEAVPGIVTGEAAAAASREQDVRFNQALAAAQQAKQTTEQQVTRGPQEITTQTTFDKKGRQEKNLLEESIRNFERQQQLAQAQERSISGRGGLQTQARDVLGDIQAGTAFDPTAGEQARIDALTGAGLAQGESRVNRILNERLAAIEADAANRGLRGQAFSQLQTGALGAAAESLTEQQLAANQQAAQLGIQLPGQRVGLQAQTAGGLADFRDVAQQQAIQNRQLLQDPVALQQLRDERLRAGTQTQNIGQQTVGTTGSTTGLGIPGLLQAQAAAPGEQAAKTAGILGVIDTGVRAAGAGSG